MIFFFGILAGRGSAGVSSSSRSFSLGDLAGSDAGLSSSSSSSSLGSLGKTFLFGEAKGDGDSLPPSPSASLGFLGRTFFLSTFTGFSSSSSARPIGFLGIIFFLSTLTGFLGAGVSEPSVFVFSTLSSFASFFAASSVVTVVAATSAAVPLLVLSSPFCSGSAVSLHFSLIFFWWTVFLFEEDVFSFLTLSSPCFSFFNFGFGSVGGGGDGTAVFAAASLGLTTSCGCWSGESLPAIAGFAGNAIERWPLRNFESPRCFCLAETLANSTFTGVGVAGAESSLVLSSPVSSAALLLLRSLLSKTVDVNFVILGARSPTNTLS